MPERSCDIVLPTFNNARVLPGVLSALFAQTIPAPWKVRLLAVDDGSHDDSASVVRQALKKSDWAGAVLEAEHCGAAAARNQALRQVHAEVVFFLGADIILRAGALAAHLRFHEAVPDVRAGALGFVRWDPRLKPSPFMEWLVHGGDQNDFDAALGGQALDPSHFFYGSHLSLKSAVLAGHSFSLEFKGYGWEDLELGRRLRERGLRLTPLVGATALHSHCHTIAQWVRRRRAVGEGLVRYQQLHPAENLIPAPSFIRRLKYLMFQWSGAKLLITMLLSVTQYHYATPRLFQMLSTSSLWEGIWSNKAEK